MNKNENPKQPDQNMTLSDSSQVTFEKIKQKNQYGAEYWSARMLQPLLGYSQWRRFEQAINRARVSCTQSGNDTGNHFADAGKMVKIGSGSVREIPDYHLSRFACYLIAQNGDPRKIKIAHAQKYFIIQTRRQEINDRDIWDITDREWVELRQPQLQWEQPRRFFDVGGQITDQIGFSCFHTTGHENSRTFLLNYPLISSANLPIP
jgi:hypothetical protein